MKTVKTIVAASCVGMVLVGSSPGAAQATGDATISVSVNGSERIAYLHAPANLKPEAKLPLVIGFHGGAGTAEGYIEISQLFPKADRAGFVAVCPEGTALFVLGRHRVWNSGPEYARSTRNADDVQFTRLLIDKVSSLYNIDPKRIYATGFSNGGQMAYRLALELGDRIAAIAPMSGGRLAGDLRPSRPVPVLHIHGTGDTVYPLKGGLGRDSIGRTPHAAIEDVIREWTAFDGAARVHAVLHSGWREQIDDGPAPVDLVLVNGMGHQIAGGTDDRLPHQAMKNTPDAVGLALTFFLAHPMR
jgi:polyhydroxybutyrate depolymerase